MPLFQLNIAKLLDVEIENSIKPLSMFCCLRAQKNQTLAPAADVVTGGLAADPASWRIVARASCGIGCCW